MAVRVNHAVIRWVMNTKETNCQGGQASMMGAQRIGFDSKPLFAETKTVV